MALIFDGAGEGQFPDLIYTGEFSLSIPDFIYRGSTAIIVGDSASNANFIACFSGGIIRIRVTGTDMSISGGFVDGDTITGNSVSRDAAGLVTCTFGGTTSSFTRTGTFSLDRLGSYNGGSLRYTGEMDGIFTATGTGTTSRSYDLAQPTGTTVLPDTVSNEDGSLVGFTTGGFVTGAGNATPIANAGVDQIGVAQGATVTLDGTGSSDSDGTITYSWVQTLGTAVTLSSATAISPTFTAPATVETLTFELTVTDDGGLTSTDTVSIGVVAAATPTITITSPTGEGKYKQRNSETNNASFTVSGTTANLPAGATVEISLDSGAYTTLDANPTSTFSGSVTVTSTQEITVRINDAGTFYTSSPITLAAVADILGFGQSNMEGRVTNLHTISLNDGAKQPLKSILGVTSNLTEPTNIGGGTEGTLMTRVIELLANANPTITYRFTNIASGGWTFSEYIAGGSQSGLTRMNSAIAANGSSYEAAFMLQGETDALNNLSEADTITQVNTIVNYIKTNAGADTYIIDVPVTTRAGTTAIRAGFDSVIANNESAFFGGDLVPLDISNTGGDGLHVNTDAQAIQAAQIVFDAYNALNSAITVSGIPDGTHNLFLVNQSTGVIAFNGNATFSGGAASVALNADVGVTLKGYVDDGTNTNPIGGRVLKVV